MDQTGNLGLVFRYRPPPVWRHCETLRQHFNWGNVGGPSDILRLSAETPCNVNFSTGMREPTWGWCHQLCKRMYESTYRDSGIFSVGLPNFKPSRTHLNSSKGVAKRLKS